MTTPERAYFHPISPAAVPGAPAAALGAPVMASSPSIVCTLSAGPSVLSTPSLHSQSPVFRDAPVPAFVPTAVPPPATGTLMRGPIRQHKKRRLMPEAQAEENKLFCLWLKADTARNVMQEEKLRLQIIKLKSDLNLE